MMFMMLISIVLMVLMMFIMFMLLMMYMVLNNLQIYLTFCFPFYSKHAYVSVSNRDKKNS